MFCDEKLTVAGYKNVRFFYSHTFKWLAWEKFGLERFWWKLIRWKTLHTQRNWHLLSNLNRMYQIINTYHYFCNSSSWILLIGVILKCLAYKSNKYSMSKHSYIQAWYNKTYKNDHTYKNTKSIKKTKIFKLWRE